jgi:hypothetical protein
MAECQHFPQLQAQDKTPGANKTPGAGQDTWRRARHLAQDKTPGANTNLLWMASPEEADRLRTASIPPTLTASSSEPWISVSLRRASSAERGAAWPSNIFSQCRLREFTNLCRNIQQLIQTKLQKKKNHITVLCELLSVENRTSFVTFLIHVGWPPHFASVNPLCICTNVLGLRPMGWS